MSCWLELPPAEAVALLANSAEPPWETALLDPATGGGGGVTVSDGSGVGGNSDAGGDTGSGGHGEGGIDARACGGCGAAGGETGLATRPVVWERAASSAEWEHDVVWCARPEGTVAIHRFTPRPGGLAGNSWHARTMPQISESAAWGC